MSLKAELETWAAALNAYDEENFEQSLELFSVSLYSLPLILTLTHFNTAHRRLFKNPNQYGPNLRNSR